MRKIEGQRRNLGVSVKIINVNKKVEVKGTINTDILKRIDFLQYDPAGSDFFLVLGKILFVHLN